MRARERAGDDRRELARPSYVWRRATGTRTWIPREPLVFGKLSSPSRSSVCLDEQRDLDHLLEADVLGRVEVEEHPVGPLGLVDARRPRVQVDAAHVHHPEQRELVVDERVVDRSRFSPSRVETGNGARSIQSGMCDGASFWKKCLPCQPSG